MRDRRVWNFILGNAVDRRALPWFWMRFVSSATLVVDRWGPRWSRRKVWRQPIGVWLLGVTWSVGLALRDPLI